MNQAQIDVVYDTARRTGDLPLQAACWQAIAGYVPPHLWEALTPTQRVQIAHSCDELSRMSLFEVLARNCGEFSRLTPAEAVAMSDLVDVARSPARAIDINEP